MDAKKILRSELIGRNTKATSLREKKEVKGKIIDETKHTLVLSTERGRKRLVKEAYAFEFKYEGQRIRINGKHLSKRAEERIKLRLRKDG